MTKENALLEESLRVHVEGLGYELWGIKFRSRSRHSVLSVFIDKPTGITLDDCEKVSRKLSQQLDEEDPIHGAYTLEVSSPGMDRPLFTWEQFQRYAGKDVHVEMRLPLSGKRHFKGRLLKANATHVCLHDMDLKSDVELALDSIAKANVVPEF